MSGVRRAVNIDEDTGIMMPLHDVAMMLYSLDGLADDQSMTV